MAAAVIVRSVKTPRFRIFPVTLVDGTSLWVEDASCPVNAAVSNSVFRPNDEPRLTLVMHR